MSRTGRVWERHLTFTSGILFSSLLISDFKQFKRRRYLGKGLERDPASPSEHSARLVRLIVDFYVCNHHHYCCIVYCHGRIEGLADCIPDKGIDSEASTAGRHHRKEQIVQLKSQIGIIVRNLKLKRDRLGGDRRSASSVSFSRNWRKEGAQSCTILTARSLELKKDGLGWGYCN